jgi:type I restriction enzyme, S subunit
MAQISKIRFSQLSEYFGRIDAEFYKPVSLFADKIIKGQNYRNLGSLVSDGYRVVYESKKILKLEQVDLENDARFLQATNISADGLWINVEDIGYVSGKDWQRYSKGRIKIGEVLIEVKGQAEKVTIVRNTFQNELLLQVLYLN